MNSSLFKPLVSLVEAWEKGEGELDRKLRKGNPWLKDQQELVDPVVNLDLNNISGRYEYKREMPDIYQAS